MDDGTSASAPTQGASGPKPAPPAPIIYLPASEVPPQPPARVRPRRGVHLHWIDGPCPVGSNGEAVLGYVR